MKKTLARHAERLGPESIGSTRFVVEGARVIEVASGPLPSEEVVFSGCDSGSAHAVAQALSLYWSSGGVAVAPMRDSYEVVSLAKSAAAERERLAARRLHLQLV